MPFTEFWTWLEGLPLAEHIGFTWWFPLLESVHVVAIGLVVGSILMVDLRLLGVAALRYSVTSMTRELILWTWCAFLLAMMTGAGLFITRASVYIENPAFQAKLALVLLAGFNMALFQFLTFRNVESWDTATATPVAARAAGAISLALWAAIVLAGRWVGHSI